MNAPGPVTAVPIRSWAPDLSSVETSSAKAFFAAVLESILARLPNSCKSPALVAFLVPRIQTCAQRIHREAGRDRAKRAASKADSGVMKSAEETRKKREFFLETLRLKGRTRKAQKAIKSFEALLLHEECLHFSTNKTQTVGNGDEEVWEAITTGYKTQNIRLTEPNPNIPKHSGADWELISSVENIAFTPRFLHQWRLAEDKDPMDVWVPCAFLRALRPSHICVRYFTESGLDEEPTFQRLNKIIQRIRYNYYPELDKPRTENWTLKSITYHGLFLIIPLSDPAPSTRLFFNTAEASWRNTTGKPWEVQLPRGRNILCEALGMMGSMLAKGLTEDLGAVLGSESAEARREKEKERDKYLEGSERPRKKGNDMWNGNGEAVRVRGSAGEAYVFQSGGGGLGCLVCGDR
ncbi:uncharacterized protein MKK02DRAFT_45553 [Dioszegia hungarica]|uniref:Uncharacterized protein n=1 Tax=Dioszegia hungarica TaxID=4972 RepID=A0AA38HAS1_9TREE|nr:uncharacterized protein MKK02DRAFT_45553 [Dioszegia hungarica]KAI9636846.1 hypothetical protein MKK02DRAFT_45553 [Dioszegia hungarica]